MFGAAKLTKNANPNKYVYLGYAIWFDSRSLFSIPYFHLGKSSIVFGVNMSSFLHNNKNENI